MRQAVEENIQTYLSVFWANIYWSLTRSKAFCSSSKTLKDVYDHHGYFRDKETEA